MKEDLIQEEDDKVIDFVTEREKILRKRFIENATEETLTQEKLLYAKYKLVEADLKNTAQDFGRLKKRSKVFGVLSAFASGACVGLTGVCEYIGSMATQGGDLFNGITTIVGGGISLLISFCAYKLSRAFFKKAKVYEKSQASVYEAVETLKENQDKVQKDIKDIAAHLETEQI